MTCPKCGLLQPKTESCAGCGIYFEKYLRRQAMLEAAPVAGMEAAETVSAVTEIDAGGGLDFRTEPAAFIKEILLPTATETNPIILVGKGLVLLLLLIWGAKFAFASIGSNYSGESLLHLINLPFHEAGHVFFRPFGRFMTSAGGSITQILVPLICLAVLLIKTRDAFGAGICLWWAGQNFLDLAPYINDARALVMPLVGGNTGQTSPYGFHDWEFLLTETGLLRYDHAIAQGAHLFGSFVMLLGLTWSGLVLYRHFQAGRG
jgi:hypothetical protein